MNEPNDPLARYALVMGRAIVAMADERTLGEFAQRVGEANLTLAELLAEAEEGLDTHLANANALLAELAGLKASRSEHEGRMLAAVEMPGKWRDELAAARKAVSKAEIERDMDRMALQSLAQSAVRALMDEIAGAGDDLFGQLKNLQEDNLIQLAGNELAFLKAVPVGEPQNVAPDVGTMKGAVVTELKANGRASEVSGAA